MSENQAKDAVIQALHSQLKIAASGMRIHVREGEVADDGFLVRLADSCENVIQETTSEGVLQEYKMLGELLGVCLPYFNHLYNTDQGDNYFLIRILDTLKALRPSGVAW